MIHWIALTPAQVRTLRTLRRLGVWVLDKPAWRAVERQARGRLLRPVEYARLYLKILRRTL